VLAQRSLDRIETRLETLEEFSMKGLGLDLLNLAIRHSRKDAEAHDGDEHAAAPKP
jgi:hypothetical protein